MGLISIDIKRKSYFLNFFLLQRSAKRIALGRLFKRIKLQHTLITSRTKSSISTRLDNFFSQVIRPI